MPFTNTWLSTTQIEIITSTTSNSLCSKHITNRCSGKPASPASSTMTRWTSQCTPRHSGTNRQWDVLSSPGTSQSWRAQHGRSRGGEVNNQHRWRASQPPISQRSWRAQQGPSGVEGGRKEVNTRAGEPWRGWRRRGEHMILFFRLSLS